MANARRGKSIKAKPPKADKKAGPPQPVTDDLIRNRAYEIYERRGSGPGSERDDWLEAEHELRPTRDDV